MTANTTSRQDTLFLVLSHQGGSRGGLVLPVGGQLAVGAVVPGEAVDARLDENQAELGVLVAAVTLQVLAHRHGLLDEHVKVFGDLGGESCRANKRGQYIISRRGMPIHRGVLTTWYLVFVCTCIFGFGEDHRVGHRMTAECSTWGVHFVLSMATPCFATRGSRSRPRSSQGKA